jgi:hypothetical protein
MALSGTTGYIVFVSILRVLAAWLCYLLYTNDTDIEWRVPVVYYVFSAVATLLIPLLHK